MTLIGLAATLFFFFSLLVVLSLLARSLYLAVHRRWASLRRTATFLGVYIVVYAVLLISVSLALPRQVFPAAQPECFDDWCVAALYLQASPGEIQGCPAESGETIWLATLQVSSRAKGVTQRELAVSAFLEDAAGKQYAACPSPLANSDGVIHALSDPVEPGGSFQARLAFTLPEPARPAGVVMSHGLTPGALTIGEDESLFHPHGLLEFEAK